jgi:hypothetical protein
MKLTGTRLRQIIKEEIGRLREMDDMDMHPAMFDDEEDLPDSDQLLHADKYATLIMKNRRFDDDFSIEDVMDAYGYMIRKDLEAAGADDPMGTTAYAEIRDLLNMLSVEGVIEPHPTMRHVYIKAGRPVLSPSQKMANMMKRAHSRR